MRPDPSLQPTCIRQARPEEAALVAGVLSAAAADLPQKGLALWSSAEVSEEAVKGQVSAGMYHVALEGEEPVEFDLGSADV